MNAATHQSSRGSALLGTVFGAIIGGLISLLVVLVSFGQYKERVDTLRSQVNAMHDQIKDMPSSESASAYEIQAQIESYFEDHPSSLAGAEAGAISTELEAIRSDIAKLQLDKGAMPTDSTLSREFESIKRRLSALEDRSASVPPSMGEVKVVSPGQVLLERDAFALHLKSCKRTSSKTVRVELQVVPKRDITFSIDLQAALGVRAMDMQGREGRSSTFTFGGSGSGTLNMLSGTVVPLVLDFAIASDENTIRTIRARVSIDDGQWEELETPPIAIAE